MVFDGDVVIREIRFPKGIHGAIREDSDGIANIYINESDTEEEKKKTLDHEMKHFRLRHIGSGKTLRQVEKEANS